MSLIAVFNSVLNKPRAHYKSSKPFKIRPSVLGSQCERQIMYSATGVEPDVEFPLDAKRRMKLGDSIHEMLEDVFKEAGILIQYKGPNGEVLKDMEGNDDFEFRVSAEELFIFDAKVDAVYIMDGKLWLGEYKSINERGFTQLNGPKPDHLIQGVSYLYMFNKMLAEGKFSHIEELKPFTKAEGMIFLYINKNDTQMQEFRVTNADNTFQFIVNKIFRIKEMADKGILPPCTPDYGRSCNCNWKKKSKNNQLK